MPQAVLASLLIVTQLLAFPAAPLYLCLSADGSVGIDFGPASCQRCPADGHSHDCCAQHETGCSHEEHACREHTCNTLAAAEGDDADPCGCTHIQISAPQTATLDRATVVLVNDHWVTAAPFVFDCGTVVLPDISTPPAALRVASVCSLSSAVVCSAVMRC